jgi:erythronate-4-phosphate dehydrogenase
MQITIDKKILYLKEFFDRYNYDCKSYSEEQIDNCALKDTDAFFTRTRCLCNKELLENTKVKFLTTATVGTDHIDLDYCKKNNISTFNSKGANKWSVVQYVLYVICFFVKFKKLDLKKQTIGIIGCGNIGSLLNEVLTSLDVKTILNDPNKQGDEYKSLDYLIENSTIISLHVPYEEQGEFPTKDIISSEKIKNIKKNSLLINSARGGLIDETSLLEKIKDGDIDAAIDCWSHEPEINNALLEHSLIATPHIAGYSQIGKINATKIVLEHFFKFYNLDKNEIKEYFDNIMPQTLNSEKEFKNELNNLILLSQQLKKSKTNFVFLRNSYQLRPDFSVPKLTRIIEKII